MERTLAPKRALIAQKNESVVYESCFMLHTSVNI